MPFESNIVVLKKEHLHQNATSTDQLWFVLEDIGGDVTAKSVANGKIVLRKRADFHGAALRSRLGQEDCFLCDAVLRNTSEEQFEFWSAKPIKLHSDTSYRVLTELEGVLLVVTLVSEGKFNYTLWQKVEDDYRLLKNCGGEKNTAELHFAAKTGMLQENQEVT